MPVGVDDAQILEARLRVREQRCVCASQRSAVQLSVSWQSPSVRQQPGPAAFVQRPVPASQESAVQVLPSSQSAAVAQQPSSGACEQVGRAPDSIERSVFRLVDLGEGAPGLRRLLENLGGEGLPPDAFEIVRDQHFIGSPDEVVAKAQAFVDAGARHLVVMFLDADHSDESAARFMSDVVPALRA